MSQGLEVNNTCLKNVDNNSVVTPAREPGTFWLLLREAGICKSLVATPSHLVFVFTPSPGFETEPVIAQIQGAKRPGLRCRSFVFLRDAN